METNLKPRVLWCPKCKIDTINSIPDAKCEVCKETLITVLYDTDGRRITGVEPITLPPVLLPGAKS